MTNPPSARQPGEERCVVHGRDLTFYRVRANGYESTFYACDICIEDTPRVAPPSPPAAREPETCANCGKAHGEHIRVRDWNDAPTVRWFCYEFTAETSGEDATAEFTAPPADRTAEYAALLRRVVAWRDEVDWHTFDILLADIRAALSEGKTENDQEQEPEPSRDATGGAA